MAVAAKRSSVYVTAGRAGVIGGDHVLGRRLAASRRQTPRLPDRRRHYVRRGNDVGAVRLLARAANRVEIYLNGERHRDPEPIAEPALAHRPVTVRRVSLHVTRLHSFWHWIRATHNAPGDVVWDHGTMRLSLLIVDDHEDFRRSARTLLEAEGFTVVGEAGDGAEAIAKARDVRPDVLLVDIRLPDLDGFAVAEEIAAWPDPPVVVLVSSHDAVVYRSRLASTPARGFIAKSQLSGEALADLVA